MDRKALIRILLINVTFFVISMLLISCQPNKKTSLKSDGKNPSQNELTGGQSGDLDNSSAGTAANPSDQNADSTINFNERLDPYSAEFDSVYFEKLRRRNEQLYIFDQQELPPSEVHIPKTTLDQMREELKTSKKNQPDTESKNLISKQPLPLTSKVMRVVLFPIYRTYDEDYFAVSSPSMSVVLAHAKGLSVWSDEQKKIGTWASVKVQLSNQTLQPLTANGTAVGSVISFQSLEKVWIVPNAIETPIAIKGLPLRKSLKKSGVLNVHGQIVLQKAILKEKLNAEWAMINWLDLEDYVSSVAGAEIGGGGDRKKEAAMKAQIISAKSYSAWKAGLARERKTDRGWDIYPLTSDQVYLGTHRETALTRRLVQETRGQFLVYGPDREFVHAMYHKNSGGTLCSAVECHNAAPGAYPYLTTKPDIPEVRKSQGGETPLSIDPSKIVGWLKKEKKLAGIKDQSSLRNIRITERTPARRVKTIEFTFGDEKINLAGKEARQFMSWMLKNATGDKVYQLDSLHFEFSKTAAGGQKNTLNLKYLGTRHGTGMSQDGALLLSAKGYSVQQILRFYYPGTTIEQL